MMLWTIWSIHEHHLKKGECNISIYARKLLKQLIKVAETLFCRLLRKTGLKRKGLQMPPLPPYPHTMI